MPASPSCNSTSTANSPLSSGTPQGVDLDLVTDLRGLGGGQAMFGGDSWLVFDTEGGAVGIPLR